MRGCGGVKSAWHSLRAPAAVGQEAMRCHFYRYSAKEMRTASDQGRNRNTRKPISMLRPARPCHALHIHAGCITAPHKHHCSCLCLARVYTPLGTTLNLCARMPRLCNLLRSITPCVRHELDKRQRELLLRLCSLSIRAVTGMFVTGASRARDDLRSGHRTGNSTRKAECRHAQRRAQTRVDTHANTHTG